MDVADASNSGTEMTINSRQKGARGERELAEFLRDHGVEARRGQQFSGGTDSPDVVSSLSGIHLECKRKESGNPYNWLSQAISDAGGENIPVVAHRRNRQDWIVILRLEDFLRIIPHGQTDRRGLGDDAADSGRQDAG